MTAEILSRVFQYVSEQRVGPSRAIPRDKLMALFGIDAESPTTDRAFRDWYRFAGIPSCEQRLYAPRNGADVKLCEQYLWCHMSPDRLRERIECIYKAFPKCRPAEGEQLGLGI
jgi:hypothetical protein